jgi:hypothetical protein
MNNMEEDHQGRLCHIDLLFYHHNIFPVFRAMPCAGQLISVNEEQDLSKVTCVSNGSEVQVNHLSTHDTHLRIACYQKILLAYRI